MKPKELKGMLMDKCAQVVIFDLAGVARDSCHSLVDLRPIIGSSLFERFPLVQSFAETLAALPPEENSVRLPCVEFDLINRQGFYDMEFHRHPSQPELWVWLLIDQTRIYTYMRKIQQQRNLLLIEKEDRDTGHVYDRGPASDAL